MAAVLGCAGPDLSDDEKVFFGDTNPLGFILFARNIDTPDQVRRLTHDLRAAVGRNDVPILVDQEGGRVQRLRPPHWRAAPPAGHFGTLWQQNPTAATEAVRLNAHLIGAELADLGISVDCLPVADLAFPGASNIIGDRAFGADPATVAALARAAAEGLQQAGILPVVKHAPGHGRALVDSHHDLPIVDTPREELAGTDFEAFARLADFPAMMTCHVVFTAIDGDRPATLSSTVISSVIREQIGFDGLLLTDDLSMNALSGEVYQRAVNAVEAGCDVAVHCNGDMTEMQAIAERLPMLSETAWERWSRAKASIGPPESFDTTAGKEQLSRLMNVA